MNNKTITIIEYEPRYAASIADMWNASSEGWGNRDMNRTKLSVQQEEASSSHLHLFLALDEETVAGYCKLSEYREDTGALYIDLLNVRPDYYGRKIGKQLVLKCVEQTIALGWPRLDLYTWAGNTKAVPLYKKTGFFWEDRDDCTHLMNFIPSVLQNEVVKPFFEQADWYRDSKRSIEIKPDGRRENQFDYFAYHWQKENAELQMEFCRRGRGLRKIETDDFLIEAIVENLHLIFGQSYCIRYRAVNKSGKPLTLNITGAHDQNIRFDFSTEQTVTDSWETEATFAVEPCKEEPSPWKTHPCVVSHMEINGRKCTFEIGVVPQFPAKMELRQPERIHYCGANGHVEKGNVYLNIENQFPQKATFQFRLPQNDLLQWMQPDWQIELEAHATTCLALPYQLRQGGLLAFDLDVAAQPENGSENSFTRPLSALFHTLHKRFAGHMAQKSVVANGPYQLELVTQEFYNEAFLRDIRDPQRSIFWMPLKIGEPYQDELNRKKADEIVFMEKDEAIEMRAVYSSQQFPQHRIVQVFALYANGLVEQWIEAENYGKQTSPKELCINGWTCLPLEQVTVPYENKIIQNQVAEMPEYTELEGEKFSGNWLFSQLDKGSAGCVWPQSQTIYLASWRHIFHHNLGQLAAGSTNKSKVITYFLNTFRSWEELRSYAQQQAIEPERVTPFIEYTLNNGNPFVEKQVDLQVTRHSASPWQGKLAVQIGHDEKAVTVSQPLPQTEPIASISIDLPDQPVTQIQAKLQQQHLHSVWMQAIFATQNQEVKLQTVEREQQHVFEASNEHLAISAAPGFFPGIFSLSYHDQEWLDHAFPKPCCKSWWNLWTGGIGFRPNGIRDHSLLKEKHDADFAEVHDQFGNRWQGLKISSNIEKLEKWKGFYWHQYFLLYKNAPVLACFAQFGSQHRKYLHPQSHWGAYFKPDSYAQSFLQAQDYRQRPMRFWGGGKASDVGVKQSFFVGSSQKEERLWIKWSEDLPYNVYLETQKEYICSGLNLSLNILPNQTVSTQPIFLIATDQTMQASDWDALNAIRFSMY